MEKWKFLYNLRIYFSARTKEFRERGVTTWSLGWDRWNINVVMAEQRELGTGPSSDAFRAV